MRLAEGLIVGVSLILMIATSIWVAGEKAPKSYKTYTIPAGTFDLDVQIIVTEDTAFAAKYVRENLDSAVTGADFDCRGITFPIRDGKSPIIWLPYKSPVAIINHELFHATVEVMTWASVPFNVATEEVYAYELQHLSQQLDNQINIIK